MDAIGGYFGLEKPGIGVFPHEGGILLNTGRNALEYILRAISPVKKVYLPYYTCEVVLEPINKLKIPYSRYHINEKLEIQDEIFLSEGEYLIANNYFGIKDQYILTLAEKYKEKLIVDCAQAFFAKPIPGIKSFYSCRKFVGVADGAIAYLSDEELKNAPTIEEEENTSDHDGHLLLRKQYGAEAGYSEYQKNEEKLKNQPIRRMSKKTISILQKINYLGIVEKRMQNYKCLAEKLDADNVLPYLQDEYFECPMVFPILVNDMRTRDILINNRIFVAKYWPNLEEETLNMSELNLIEHCIPIPIDQRTNMSDVNRIHKLVSILKIN